MALKVGDQAPDFKLFNTEKAEINLADYRGKNVVVLFFPLAFTGVCTAELCQMRDDIATYSGLNAEILGISVDSIFTLGKFKAEQNLPFNLLSDFNKERAVFCRLHQGLDGIDCSGTIDLAQRGTVPYAIGADKAILLLPDIRIFFGHCRSGKYTLGKCAAG